ncbi:Protein of unknown function [Bacillus mobilis]|nr:Protein of unknown function [Bacillus mobilis]
MQISAAKALAFRSGKESAK